MRWRPAIRSENRTAHLERHLREQLAMVQLGLVALDPADRVVRLGLCIAEGYREPESDRVRVVVAREHAIIGSARVADEGVRARSHRRLVRALERIPEDRRTIAICRLPL
jgi:hypothetical protein